MHDTLATRPLGIGIVGCGNIAGPYAKSIAQHDEIRLVAASDVDGARATAFAAEHGARAHASLEALLADPDVDIVVNLTVHHAHYAVTKQALEAGKHVYSEKPMALESNEAHELVELAAARGLRLACAPSTFLGEAQQTAGAIISQRPAGDRAGRLRGRQLGPDRALAPGADPVLRRRRPGGRRGLPADPATAFLGPAVAVEARGWDLLPDRVTTSGERYRIGSPDLIVATVELAGGAGHPADRQLLRRADPAASSGSSSSTATTPRSRSAASRTSMPRWRSGRTGGDYEAGRPRSASRITGPPGDAAWRTWPEAIAEGRRQRVTGEHAAHVVDILSAARQSMRERRRVADRVDVRAAGR